MNETKELVIVADGETHECRIVAEPNLYAALHHALCYCKQPWDQCESDGVTEALRVADDDDNWTMGDDGRFSLSFDFEDGRIFVYYVTERE